MSIHGSKLLEQVAGAGTSACPESMMTLADVLRRLEHDDHLDQRQLRETRSAVNTVCRALGTQPDMVPAEPRQLRPQLAKLTPAMVDVSPGRWCNVKSLTLKALRRAGLKSMAGRSREALAPDWEALRALIPDRHFQSGISRLMTYCTERGVSPTAVTPQTFVQFGLEVENYSLVRDPGGLYRDTCKLWNRAVRTIPGWPQLKVAVPDRRRTFALTLDEFPSPFRADVEGFLTRCAEPDVFSDSYYKPVAELTLRNRRGYILMAATALVQTGVPISQITSLDVIVNIDHAKALLKFLYNLAGDKTNNQIYHIATLLKTISRHHLHQSEETVDQLRRLCKKLKPEGEGFTEKNRRCLRQFADLNKLASLLRLPQRVTAQVVRRRQIRRRGAGRVRHCHRNLAQHTSARRQSRRLASRSAPAVRWRSRLSYSYIRRDEERRCGRGRVDDPFGPVTAHLRSGVQAPSYRDARALALPREKGCASSKWWIRSATERFHCEGSRRGNDAASVPPPRSKALSRPASRRI